MYSFYHNPETYRKKLPKFEFLVNTYLLNLIPSSSSSFNLQIYQHKSMICTARVKTPTVSWHFNTSLCQQRIMWSTCNHVLLRVLLLLTHNSHWKRFLVLKAFSSKINIQDVLKWTQIQKYELYTTTLCTVYIVSNIYRKIMINRVRYH